ncbi:MAG: hypothetical protein AB8H80_12990 [Planctomycetota bacterium]
MSSAAVSGMNLEFVRTRSKIIAVHVEAGLIAGSDDGLRVSIAWRERRAPPTEIRVDYAGAPPLLLQVDFLRDHDVSSANAEARLCKQHVAGGVTVEQHYAERLQHIETVADERLRGLMMAFYRIDTETQLEMVQRHDPKLADAILGLTESMMSRVECRAKALVTRGLELEDAFDDRDAALLASAGMVEPHLRKLLAREFGDGENVDRARLYDAFFAYLSGDLDLRARCGADERFAADGVPDSTNFFLFAETGLYFCDQGMNPAFWRSALPVFVAAATSYYMIYWSGETRCRHDYSPAFRQSKGLPDKGREYLRTTFDAKDMDGLKKELAAAVYRALCDEFRCS